MMYFKKERKDNINNCGKSIREEKRENNNLDSCDPGGFKSHIYIECIHLCRLGFCVV